MFIVFPTSHFYRECRRFFSSFCTKVSSRSLSLVHLCKLASSQSLTKMVADLSVCLHIFAAGVELIFFLYFYPAPTLMTSHQVFFGQSMPVKQIAADIFYFWLGGWFVVTMERILGLSSVHHPVHFSLIGFIAFLAVCDTYHRVFQSLSAFASYRLEFLSSIRPLLFYLSVCRFDWNLTTRKQ